jgi:DNA-binding NarL/FixJ family response regulator
MATMSNTGTSRIRVLSVDDHPMLHEGLAAVINAEPDMELVATAAKAQDGLRQYRETRPDVTLMDARLPDMSGIEALAAIRAEFPNARVIIFSMFQGDFEIRRALDAGARGFLLKTIPPAELVAAIRQVHAGKRCLPPDVATELAEYLNHDALTARELEVLKLIADGNRNRDVAEILSIAEDTVKVHTKHILDKLGAVDRTEAVVIAARRGIIRL